MRPTGKVKIRWSANFAYVIGLITTDGSLSKDKRHISFTSKDLELISNFQKGLGIKCNLGKKKSGSCQEKKYYIIQIGDVLFYRFLEDLGLMANKSLRLSKLKIPGKYFFDFLRGHFDGDGTFYFYQDIRWKSSYLYYFVLNSASVEHIKWLRSEINKKIKIKGHISKAKSSSVYSLRYAKRETNVILKKIYKGGKILYLRRKKKRIDSAFKIIKARMEKLVNSPA